MKPIELIIDNELGYLFETERADVIAFVPLACLAETDSGNYLIDEEAFLISGWADKSMRFSNTSEECERVFPQCERPVTDETDPRVLKLLERLRHVYTVSGGTE